MRKCLELNMKILLDVFTYFQIYEKRTNYNKKLRQIKQ